MSLQKDPPKFGVGDRVIFLGSAMSCYGTNKRSDKYIGTTVTIKERHPTGHPYAYIFKEFGQEYFFSENCFEVVLPDLPEFEASGLIEALLF